METEALWHATKEKHQGLFQSVLHMRVRDKRNLFFILRQCKDVTVDTFVPLYGLHCGEFACFQLLAEHVRKEAKDAAEEPVPLAS
jgi:hypothetical protein